MSSPSTPSEKLGVLLAIGAAFGFAFKAIFIKLAYAIPQPVPLEAVTLLALRMVFSLPAFFWVGFTATRASTPLTLRDKFALLILGVLGYYGASILDFIGLHYISAGLERLILMTYPMLTVLIGLLFLGRSVSRREIIAMLLTYGGIGFAFSHDLHVAEDRTQVLIGGAFVFASALSYAIYLSGSATAITRLGTARFTALAMLVSTGATFLHFFISEPLSALIQPWPVYAYGIAMALFSTVIPVFMQSAAIHRIGTSRAVIIGTLGPVLTLFFGWWILQEPMSWMQVSGAALVLMGVLLVSLKRPRA